MATNDFIYDIVEKLRDENLEFLIVHFGPQIARAAFDTVTLLIAAV